MPEDPNQLPEQNGPHFQDFLDQLRSITGSLETIANTQVELTAKLNKQVAQNLANAPGGSTSSNSADVGQSPQLQFDDVGSGGLSKKLAQEQLAQTASAVGMVASTPEKAAAAIDDGSGATNGEPPASSEDNPSEPDGGGGRIRRGLKMISHFGKLRRGQGMPDDSPLKDLGDTPVKVLENIGMASFGTKALMSVGRGALDVASVPFNVGSSFAQTGAGLGFSNTNPTIGIPGTGIGFSIPTGQQFAEGVKLEFAKAKMAAQPKINMGQANQIFNATNELGWSAMGPMGPEAENFRAGLADVARNNQSYDITTVAEAMDHAIRNSNASIQQFTGFLRDLPQAAGAAKISLNELLDQSIQFAEASQQMGSTFYGGLERAKNWTLLTGTSPTIGQSLMSNNFVQSFGLQQTGLLPQQQGIMTAGQSAQVTGDTVSFLMKMMQGTTHATQNTDKFGLTRRYSGIQASAAMVAQMLGVPVATVLQLDAQNKKIQRRSEALDAYKGFTGQFAGSPAERAKDLDLSVKMLQQLGFKQGRIDKFRADALKNPELGSKDLQKMLENNRTATANAGPGTLEINLSPDAKKWFRFKSGPSPNKKISNSGGTAIVQQIAENSQHLPLFNQK